MRVCLVGLICFMSVRSAVGAAMQATAAIGSAVKTEKAMSTADNNFLTITATAPATLSSGQGARIVKIVFNSDVFDATDVVVGSFDVASSVTTTEWVRTFATDTLTLTAQVEADESAVMMAAGEALTIKVQAGKIKQDTGCKTGGITVTPYQTGGTTTAETATAAPAITLNDGVCAHCVLTADVKELTDKASCFCGPEDRTLTATTAANLKLCYHATKTMTCTRKGLGETPATLDAKDTYACAEKPAAAAADKANAQSLSLAGVSLFMVFIVSRMI